MSEEKKLAVLIDSDNVSAKYAQFVMNEVQKYGVPTYKRVYGDWEKGGNGCSRSQLLDNAGSADKLCCRQERYGFLHDNRRDGHSVHRQC